MFYKIKEVYPLPDFELSVLFCNGTTKKYDVSPLIKSMADFKPLEDVDFFNSVQLDLGGYGISWNDVIDISCDELWNNGVEQSTPFDGLMAFSDATTLWGLNESTLRKAISYGKLATGIDARKYGKQWIVTRSAMFREYGEPLSKNTQGE